MTFFKKKLFFLPIFLFFLAILPANAQLSETSNTDSRVEIFLSPRSGSFVEGATFEVPILINTNATSIDAIRLKINFDSDKLLIVNPSGGKSIIGVWVESPRYDNAKGTVTYVGDIPGGIVTDSGLIGTITFKALGAGPARVGIDASSKISLHDGLETDARLDPGRAEYTILKKAPEGVQVFSETHPSEGKWYNNNSPVLSWQRDAGVTGFSFLLDNKPFTVPDNVADSNENTTSFDNLKDGLWYFHIKALKNGAWGTTGHFLVKIDTIPPAEFQPKANYFIANVILSGRTLISFFTTDNLSGVDHYEVGTIDKSQPITEAPVFIEAGSPFQVPLLESSTMKVIVRAIDKAGNVREGYIEVSPPILIWRFIQSNLSLLLIALGLLGFLLYRILKARRITNLGNSGTFGILESDIKNYLNKRKEIAKRDFIEKEKLEILEKDLENAKAQIDEEMHSSDKNIL